MALSTDIVGTVTYIYANGAPVGYSSEPATAWHSWIGVFNGATSSIQRDGSTPVTGNAGASNGGGFNLGSAGAGLGNFANCDIAEAGVYNRVLSAPEIGSLYSYLKGKYGLP
jgi:hypothetical protein